MPVSVRNAGVSKKHWCRYERPPGFESRYVNFYYKSGSGSRSYLDSYHIYYQKFEWKLRKQSKKFNFINHFHILCTIWHNFFSHWPQNCSDKISKSSIPNWSTKFGSVIQDYGSAVYPKEILYLRIHNTAQ